MLPRPMWFRSLLLAAGLLAFQPSYADPVPVPSSKSAYVGEWLGEKMRLKIQQDGHVEYKRDRPNKHISLNADLQGFDGDDFDIGVGFVRSTFVVTKPPHRENGKWKMTVDGVELTRTE
jgi:hypothetical protein